MDQPPHDASPTSNTEDEAARIAAFIRDGWWLLLSLALFLFLVRAL